MSLKGKIAVVTGSTSGIGLGIAVELAARGAKVAVNSFSDNESDHAATQEVRDAAKDGGDAIYVQADMSDPAACRALVTKTAEHWGGVDILVNNAGIQFVTGVDEFPTEKWDAIIAINLSSA
ncbi:MAG: SDR family NAD(P)-dependent oxidoreductase, partial [Pseudomonadota bacterium]